MEGVQGLFILSREPVMSSHSSDLSGGHYGGLEVIKRAGSVPRPDGHGTMMMWECRCTQCNNILLVETQNVCRCPGGCRKCWGPRVMRGRARTHGEATNGKLTTEYQSWRNMIRRCRDVRSKDYPDYGGRGIKVCERWQKFENFLSDMRRKPTSKHSINRKDNDGDYCPENCEWATKKQQAQNRKNVVWLTHDGETLCVADWAARLGLDSRVLYGRLKRGLPVEQVLSPGKLKTGPKPR